MADSEYCDGRSSSSSRLLNPWVLNFQKLGLELKCPLCLRLLNRPTVLPCNHVFCNSCIPGPTQFGADCPVCKAHFVDRDMRRLPLIENMLTIYKCLDNNFSADLLQQAYSDAERVSMHGPTDIWFGDYSRNGQSIDKQFRVDKNGKVDNREYERNDKGIVFTGAKNPKLSSPRSRMRGGGTEECKTLEIDLNPVAQSSPDSHSPPLFGNARDSDNDSYYQYRKHSSKNSLVKRSSEEKNGSRVGNLRYGSSGFGKDGDSREVKRQKQLNFGLEQLGVSSADHNQAVSNAGALLTNSEPELRTISQPSVQSPKILDGQCANKTVCAFCHTSEISVEDTGTMLHYSSGQLVEGYEATLPNVIHVHKVCIDWAPRVHYIDGRIKYLKEEVTRGAKLKCSECGKKGAALGCYVKSCRRSYHVPCAIRVSKCRWDYDDFLMLCPAHSSVRFPNENSKSWKNLLSKDHDIPAIVSCQLSNLVPSPDGEKILFFCGSALSDEEKFLIIKFGKMIGATLSKFWDPNVTHVIAATDDKGACTRTFKFLMAILTGSWIVKVDWIKACIEAKCHVNEEPYEVSLDNYGCCHGPKTGRLRASNNEPKLFSSLNFFFVGDFLASHKEDLQDLVTTAGGTVLKSREELIAQSCEDTAPTPTSLVVYSTDPPEGCKLGEEVVILFQRLSEAEDMASQTGSKVIGHTWLLESIAGHKLHSIVG